jgi:hypothetical protein
MSEQPILDINDGKPWSEMDLFDLRNSVAYGRSIEEVAGFLCRSGTVEEVKRTAEELGLLRSNQGWHGAVMDKDYLLLKRASASRPSGQWNDDDFDVLANGVVVGRIFKANASPVGHRGCGHWPLGITKIERPHMAMPRLERLRWRRLPRAGGTNDPPDYRCSSL